MIIIKVEQGSEAWFQERCGRFTASKFSTLMSGLSTKGYKDLITDVAGEVITGEVEETYTNDNMKRGTELEPEARQVFMDETGLNVHEVGFVLNERFEDWVGVSPDGMIFTDESILEIKCPLRKTHLNYIRANKLPSEYKWQVQGQLLITGVKKAYFMSYYPKMKPFIIEVLPDVEMHNQLLERFEVAINDVKEQIKNYNEYE